jgi:hypothetical protein
MHEQTMSQNPDKENQTPASMEDQLAQLAISSTKNGTMTAPVNTTSQKVKQVDILDLEPVFTCFPRLASELRYKIWKIAATQLSRVLTLHESRQTRNFGDLGSAFTVLQRSKSPQPALLQVNRESRRETIALYELIMGTQFHINSDPFIGPEFKILGHEPRVYFNADADTIYLSRRFICGDFNEFVGMLYSGRWGAPVIKSLRSIALDVEHFIQGRILDSTIHDCI